jgi:hypothetical protein
MPSLGSHLAIARVLAGRVAHGAIDADRGSYYLGATAPDIRVLTRMDREHTHFFTLDELTHQDSVARLFAAHPHLQDAPALDAPTRAFMAGYLTHLLMDQLYIERIYREFFGSGSAFGDDPRGNVLDRVLQYELDRREREQADAMAEIREALAGCSAAADVRFIERATLERWREVAADIAAQPPDWERFRRIASRHLQAAGLDSEEGLAQFYRDLPAVLQETLDHVTEARVSEFMTAAIDAATEQLREYLR